MKTRELKAHELMDGCLYLVGKQVVRYRVLNNGFETLDGKRLGTLTVSPRARALCCRVMTQKTPSGVVWHNEYVKPIPLTEEILENNGFTQIEDGIIIYDLPEGIWQNDNALCGIDYNDRGSFYTFSNDPEDDGLINKVCGVVDVHQLQHALRLCGIDELADNFVV